MQRTLENLTKAFVGESQARNRYTFYSKQASKEGFEQIAAIFAETAEQEKTHAKRLFEHIQELKARLGGDLSSLKIETEAPTIYDTTAENLKAAIAGEKHETDEMYPEFAKIAEEEGLPEIADRLRAIAKAEAHHQERYEKLLKEVEAGTVFKKSEQVTWVCRECGYMHVGDEPPAKCPACNHPRSYYEVQSENY